MGHATVQAVGCSGRRRSTWLHRRGNILPVPEGNVLWYFVDVELITTPVPDTDPACFEDLDKECLDDLSQDGLALINHYRRAAADWELHTGRRFDHRLAELLVIVGELLRGNRPPIDDVFKILAELEQSGFAVRGPNRSETKRSKECKEWLTRFASESGRI